MRADRDLLLAEAYQLLCEAEAYLEEYGFTLGTGRDGAFIARSTDFRERISGAIDLRLRRILEEHYGKKGGAR